MVYERDAAWSMLHERATDAAALAEIAGTYPEFADAVGRHPNAYPALVAWARDQAPAPRVAETVAPSPFGDPAADRSPRLPRPAARTRRRTLWIAVLVVVLVAPAVTMLFDNLAFLVYAENDVLFAFAELGARFAVSAPGVALAVCAGIAAPTAGRKAGAVAMGLVSAALYLPVTLDITPVFFGLPTAVLLSVLMSVLLFLGWAIGRPLRGAAYATVPIVVLLAVTVTWSTFALSVVVGDPVLFGVLFVLIRAAAALLVVWIARTLSRVSERRLVQRPVAAAQTGLVQMPFAIAPAAPGSPQVAYVMIPATSRTNTMAVMALVSAFVVSLLGIIFGHIALAQIARTGESGRGLAVAGLVLGYIGVGLGAVVVLFYLIVVGAMLRF
ncbi:DUF4190 domain-containing protein [Microbacterium sp. SORGH_AS_0888]|uniref:DUF4190 domain-containing protein n=1 Tax=Microbacterium sp. SORGH_AS_0888 TaxID=3041791 RepID=UPI0027D81774|nr:DUF4190 domain-containing protein [Microbacterium sp. SORGH_AS_0888]